ncbi:hypothetical protein A0O28_0110150 [Trichoderma guizhouense]|uniref:Uncharacterized protein n=1 Tax=Trichoderma guizhouense TaxID=1491466 RepID=A0A1T3C5C7_9HYPO|nr:hypothetical protein A0O28_0110150 [Trichoderma guizhouense]
MIKVFSSIRSTYRAVSVAIDGENISNDMRRSLELVRTCNQDLQELIRLRNEHLRLLEKQPQILERLNSIIEKVHNGLLEASRIVEKYRPELHSGKKSLQTQIAWAHRDSQDFQAMGPTMSQHNATILAEISFLRSLTIITTQSKPEAKEIEILGSDDKTLFNNLELLEDFMGDVSGSRDIPPTSPPAPLPPPAIQVNARASMPNLLMNQEYCDLPEPVIPNIIPHQQPIASLLASEQTSTLRTLSGETLEDGNQRNSRVVLNQTDHSGLSLLFGDELDLSFDLSPKVQPQHSRAQSSDSMHKSSIPSFSPSSANGGTVNSTPLTRYSLTSQPSTLSVSSIGTLNPQSPEPSMSRPHLFSLPPTPPTNTTAQLASLSAATLTSETQQDARSKPRTMSFAERYANLAEDSGQEGRRYRPWRPYKNGDIYELQGSEISPEGHPFAQSTTSLSHRSTT